MKCLIIGLGCFGKTLAEALTDKGHDVIGVDSDEHRVEEVKDRISVAYIMDATERVALKELPLDEIVPCWRICRCGRPARSCIGW